MKPDQISSRLDQIVTAERVEATQSGKDALMNLAAGDMRRVLNLLQSTFMAYPMVNEENVYLTAGAALPHVIQSIFKSLLNDTYEDAYKLLAGVSKINIHLFLLILFVSNVIVFVLLSSRFMSLVMPYVISSQN